MIRKNAHQSDEKPAAELPSGKTSPAKSARATKVIPHKGGKRSPSIAQITANRNVYLENDEKDVKKYKKPRTESSLSAVKPVSDKSKTITKSKANSRNTIDGPLW